MPTDLRYLSKYLTKSIGETLDPDNCLTPSPPSGDADVWLTRQEVEISSGDWTNPDLGKMAFKQYGLDWINERPGLRPKTVQLYEGLFRIHLVPTFGNQAMNEGKAAQYESGARRCWTRVRGR
jgi:hypothetical protein